MLFGLKFLEGTKQRFLAIMFFSSFTRFRAKQVNEEVVCVNMFFKIAQETEFIFQR